MTYKKWMQLTGAKFNLSEDDIELIAANQGIDLEAEADVTTAKKALVSEFALVIPMANVTEGGYSLSWNMEALKLWYRQACSELGITPVTTPSIRNASNRW